MKRSALGLLSLLLFLPAVALADLESVSPSSFFQYDIEVFATVQGVQLIGNVSTQLIISGPGGTFTMDSSGEHQTVINNRIVDQVYVAIPDGVLAVTGQYSVIVLSNDNTGTRRSSPGFFDVVARVVQQQPPLITVPENVTAEAESTAGGHATFSVTGISFVDPPPAPTISCNYNSGDLFPLGVTKVTCTATDSFGSASASFDVFVTDTTPPVVTVPSDISSTSSVVTFTASAFDALDGNRPVTCSPASGSSFPNGRTTVRCTAQDTRFNLGSATFVVTVSDTSLPPELTVPDDMELEATGPAGRTVTYVVTASQNATITCNQPSGSIFGIGINTVNCSATSPGGTTTGSFLIMVFDTTAPVLTLPSTITVAATDANGAVVNYTATANDLVDPSVSVTCDHASGSTFPIGTTTVQCRATDSSFNFAVGSFDVIVSDQDRTPPVVSVPADITVEATSPAGATVSFTVTANDAVDGPVPVTCSRASGSTFAVGTTTVQCSATDAHNNTGTGSFLVIVRDTTPPVLTLPANITAEATSPNGAAVSYSATARDIVDVSDPVLCDHASGSTFPLGSTTVQCTATDAHNNTGRGSFTVLVRDTTAPVIVKITASPESLWPPNGKMVEVTITVIATDAADNHPVSHIVSVSSNDNNQNGGNQGGGNNQGGNNQGNDSKWQITGPLTVLLLAENDNTRVYTITIETTDASGNKTQGTVKVAVKNPRGRASH